MTSPDPREREEPRMTHGRHCPCSACARQDWTDPILAHCEMHGLDCPAVYAPIQDRPVADQEPLSAEEVERIRRWLAGDDNVSLSALFDDAAAYPSVSRAVRATLDASRSHPDEAGLRAAIEALENDSPDIAEARGWARHRTAVLALLSAQPAVPVATVPDWPFGDPRWNEWLPAVPVAAPDGSYDDWYAQPAVPVAGAEEGQWAHGRVTDSFHTPHRRAAQPEDDGLDAVAALGLSDEQTDILRGHLASRQQTVAEFFGDVLMEYGLGQATGKKYPPPSAVRPESSEGVERRDGA